MPHYLWRMSVRAANWETIRSQRTEQESAGVLSASDLVSRLTKSCPMKVKMDDTRAAGATAPKCPAIPAQPAVSESHFVVSCRVELASRETFPRHIRPRLTDEVISEVDCKARIYS